MIWLKYISLAAPIISLVLGWRQRFSLLWLYAAAGLICDNLSMLLKASGLNYRIPGNIFVLAELLFISLYYRNRIFSSGKIFNTMTIVLGLGFVAHTVISSIFQMNFLGAGILCAVYIAYGIAGYLRMLRSPKIIYLNNSPFFWINTAFFLYAASNCLLFLFITYLKSEDIDLMMSVWGNYFTVVNILHYIFIGIGLYKIKTTNEA